MRRTKRKPKKAEYKMEVYLLFFLLGFVTAYMLVNYETETMEENLTAIPVSDVMYASSNIVAVSSYDNTGILGSVEIEIHTGRGRVLMNTNPFLEPDTQQSAETAVSIAEQFTGKSLSDRDVILSFNITGELLGGPSAGASITAAVIAAIEGKSVNSKTAVTGTIEEDGSIGKIGSVLEKAQAAADVGIELFLVPEGQGTVTYYEQKTEERRIGRFVYQRVYYVPKTVDLNNYTMQWEMQVKEVSDIEALVEYMIE
jgi:predicted S18 family serine protease